MSNGAGSSRMHTDCATRLTISKSSQLEHGKETNEWPEEAQKAHKYLVTHGGEAKYTPLFTFSV
jgi:hypothetical protein